MLALIRLNEMIRRKFLYTSSMLDHFGRFAKPRALRGSDILQIFLNVGL